MAKRSRVSKDEGGVKLPDMEIRGQQIQVGLYLSGDGAHFTSELNGTIYRDVSLEGLRTKLLKASRKIAVRFRVPFAQETKIHHGRECVVRRGVIYGVHAANDSYLVEWEDGVKEQMNAYRTSTYSTPYLVPGITNGEIEKLVELRKLHEAAEKRYETFRTGFTMNLRTAVDKAQKQAVEELDKKEAK